ncbi:hypothetical protein RhiirA4_482276 [Rhizophagus irregularis]|uniref:Uncharacterized protein n=1 Tax=Rhizophagus irregularis TaxID=588596 RepID=A0A2I1HKV4_9GLOM|nr:hypothetical protein RhiirA4_482276 [Rhizophagus irregularis]
MTDYDLFNDFWGDFIVRVGVAIIATRISGKTEYGNNITGGETEDRNNNKKKVGDVLNDIIVFSSLNAMNIYLPITWLKYINEVNIGFEVFLSIEFWILPITAGFFGLTPNAYNFFDVVFDEFCTNKYSYKNGMIDKISKSITPILLVVVWIFTSNFLKGAILIQAVRNGYLLSNNFWQIKVTTALATVSIIRLIDIFNNKSLSLYSSIFNKVTALQQSSEGTSNEA